MPLVSLPISSVRIAKQSAASLHKLQCRSGDRESRRVPGNVGQLSGSRFRVFNVLASFPQRRSYDSVVEDLLCRSKRHIPIVNDKTRHAMRIGAFFGSPNPKQWGFTIKIELP
jgi:hypothetical protein